MPSEMLSGAESARSLQPSVTNPTAVYAESAKKLIACKSGQTHPLHRAQDKWLQLRNTMPLVLYTNAHKLSSHNDVDEHQTD